MSNTPKLTTQRLILRRFTEADIPALFTILQDEAVNKFLPWFPLTTEAAARTVYEQQYLSVYQQERGYQYAICLKSNNIPIGYLKIDLDDSYDLGYGLRKEFWHQGIVTEAGQAIVQQAKLDGLPYLTATHDVNNPRSGAVMRKLGMNYQYSYEELWQPKNFLVTFRLYLLNLDGQTQRTYQKYWQQSTVHFVEKNLDGD
ncbi:GNAT family N-acetyltransferase [Lapidilactobacillus wuchangensis]|uniref:GNAT family N-acetyltransferase n=1 Tax=Lapidilactobacillus wuchangensis TaxID=2486001 RepID=UPI000F7849B7|nr:GNAT family N-acetyltransferase [Lapidilactobacillus wuchangensis]